MLCLLELTLVRISSRMKIAVPGSLSPNQSTKTITSTVSRLGQSNLASTGRVLNKAAADNLSKYSIKISFKKN